LRKGARKVFRARVPGGDDLSREPPRSQGPRNRGTCPWPSAVSQTFQEGSRYLEDFSNLAQNRMRRHVSAVDRPNPEL